MKKSMTEFGLGNSKWVVLGLWLLTAACGDATPPVSSLSEQSSYNQMINTYERLAPRGSEHLLADPGQCDALLFHALESVALNEPSTDIWKFEIEPGKWARRPDYQACRTFTSRDMLLGAIVYFYKFKEVDAAKRMLEYARAHNYYMGEGATPDTDSFAKQVLTPNLAGLLARVIYDLDGTEYIERFSPRLRGAEEGYEAHLGMLQVWIESEIDGEMSYLDSRYMHNIAEKAPSNVLALALLERYGKGAPQSFVSTVLRIWPSDRLPTTSDWCEQWRTQRSDVDTNLKPCTYKKYTHSGGDLLFAAMVRGDLT